MVSLYTVASADGSPIGTTALSPSIRNLPVSEQAILIPLLLALCSGKNDQRDSDIYLARVGGEGVEEIAARHSLTTSRVRQIVDRVTRYARRSKQYIYNQIKRRR